MRRPVYLMLLATGNLLAGLLGQLVIYTEIGPGDSTDAYFAGMMVPLMVSGMVTVGLSAVLIPHFAGERHKDQNDDAWSLITLVGGGFLLLALVLYLTAPWWVVMFFPGFNTETSELCIEVSRVLVISMGFLAATAILNAVGFARRKFVLIEGVTLVITMSATGLMYLAVARFGIQAAAWIEMGRMFVQMAVFLPILGRPVTSLESLSSAIRILHKIKPVLLGSSYAKTDVLVDRYLLSMGNSGDISLFSLAQQIYSAAANVLARAFGTTALAELSVHVKQRDLDAFRRLYYRKLLILVGIPFLAFLVLLFVGEPILNMVLAYGEMSASHIHSLWEIMVWLSGVLIFSASGALLAGAFYAVGDTRTPAFIGMITITGFIVMKYIAFQSTGVIGISVATSVFYAFNAFLLFIIFPKKLRSLIA